MLKATSSFSIGWGHVSCDHQKAIQPPQVDGGGLAAFDPLLAPDTGTVTYLGDDSLHLMPAFSGLLLVWMICNDGSDTTWTSLGTWPIGEYRTCRVRGEYRINRVS